MDLSGANIGFKTSFVCLSCRKPSTNRIIPSASAPTWGVHVRYLAPLISRLNIDNTHPGRAFHAVCTALLPGSHLVPGQQVLVLYYLCDAVAGLPRFFQLASRGSSVVRSACSYLEVSSHPFDLSVWLPWVTLCMWAVDAFTERLTDSPCQVLLYVQC